MGVNGLLPELRGGADKLSRYGLSNLNSYSVEINTDTLSSPSSARQTTPRTAGEGRGAASEVRKTRRGRRGRDAEEEGRGRQGGGALEVQAWPQGRGRGARRADGAVGEASVRRRGKGHEGEGLLASVTKGGARKTSGSGRWRRG